MGAGSARPVVSRTIRPKAGRAPEFAARHDVAQRLDEIAAQGAADAAAVDEDGVAGQRLVQQMVEPDLAPFVDDHQRVGERRRAQEAVDQRGLAGAEKTGDDMKADRVAAPTLRDAGRSCCAWKHMILL